MEQESDELKTIEIRSTENLDNDPIILEGKFDIIGGAINDTYIDPTRWGKHFCDFVEVDFNFFFFIQTKQGFIVVNGFNLGRYWPSIGSQVTINLPKGILLKKNNSIIVVEVEKAPKNGEIKFSKIISYLNYFICCS